MRVKPGVAGLDPAPLPVAFRSPHLEAAKRLHVNTLPVATAPRNTPESTGDDAPRNTPGKSEADALAPGASDAP